MNPNAPPTYLDGCRVLAYAAVPHNAEFTGVLQLNVDGTWIGRVPHLAICEWDVRSELMLMHCDERWNVIGVQAWNALGAAAPETVAEVVDQAGRYYRGLESAWVYVAPYKGRA
jgi:hypothetical protein